MWVGAGFSGLKIIGGKGFGLLVNSIIGIIGGVLGGWVFSLVGFHSSSIIGSIITSVVGAVLFLWIINLFRGKKKE